ncbi:hypothetical protein FHG87_012993 [Trinorchestia longiramus]|nr:hypothetical protein FHG87_012993 [Trinorchestia longiramus]
MTDNFSECSLSVIVENKPTLCTPLTSKLQFITSSLDNYQVLRETFDKVQTLLQKNVFLLVDEVQIRLTVSFSLTTSHVCTVDLVRYGLCYIKEARSTSDSDLDSEPV